MRTSGLGIKGENILSFNEFLLCIKHFVSIFIDYMCPIFPNEEIKSWKMTRASPKDVERLQLAILVKFNIHLTNY